MKRDSSTSWLHLKSDLRSIQETIQNLESSVRKVEAELIEAEDREEGLNLRHVSRNLKALRDGESQEAILEQLLNQSLEYVERAILFLKEGETFFPLKESNLPLDLGSLEIEDPEDPVARCARHKAVLEIESHIPEKLPWMPADTESGRSAVCIPVLFSNSPRIVFYGDSRETIDVHGLELLLQLGALVLQNHYLTVMNSGTWQPEKQTRWPALEEDEAPAPEPEGAEPAFEKPFRETETPAVAEPVTAEEEEGASEPVLTVDEPPEIEADAEPEPADAGFTMSDEVGSTELPEGEAPAPEEVAEGEDESLRDEFLEAVRAERERSDERSRFSMEDVQSSEIEREEPQSSEEELSLETDREGELSLEADRIEIEDTFEPFDIPGEEDARRVVFDFDDEEETREDFGEQAAAEPEERDEDFDWEQAALADSDSLLTETGEEERAAEEPPVEAAVEAEEMIIDEDEETIHADAKRFARLLVTEIKLYHEQDVVEGRESSDLYTRLKRDIDRSREMYEKRADPRVKEKADYFHEEMVRILAQENPSLMGADYPGPRLSDSGA